ncbi:MAG TPA: hypothetical protein PKC49_08400 [Phycisphaerae bacterium]|nr:hypothetical protein [Phycisphaerae bacterium]
MRSTVACLMLVLGVAPGCAWQSPVPVSRSDLAASYLAFERALAANPPPAERIADLNLRFDRATIAFFAGQFSRAIAEIDALTESLSPDAASPGRRVGISLKVRLDPPVGLAGAKDPVRVEVAGLYPVPFGDAAALEFVVRLRPEQGEPLSAALSLRAAPGGLILEDVVWPAPPGGLRAGRYAIEVVTSEGESLDKGEWYVSARPLSALRRENEQRLNALQLDEPALVRARTICLARNRLLTDTPSDERSAEYLNDPLRHADEIEAELRALEAGANPYRNRDGEIYRVVPGAREIPVRVFATGATVDASAPPAALVVAFHGAGGEERMFMDAYGAGRLRTLARERGFILATPLTEPFLRESAAFDRLLESLRSDYAIDPDRVYVVGHSLGAGVTAQLARRRSDVLAGAACIAGGSGWAGAGSTAPSLVVLGELDPIVPPQRVRVEVRSAIAAGKPLELRVRAGYGHTLVVGAALPEVVEWLLARKRGS